MPLDDLGEIRQDLCEIRRGLAARSAVVAAKMAASPPTKLDDNLSRMDDTLSLASLLFRRHDHLELFAEGIGLLVACAVEAIKAEMRDSLSLDQV